MRIKQILFGGLLCAAAISTAQNTITFQPHYKVGQTMRYAMDMSMSAPQAMTMHMVVAQKVSKIYPNGDVEMAVTTSDGKMNMGGQSRALPGNTTTMKVNKYGQPVNGAGANMMGSMGFDPGSMASMVPHRPLKVGETIPLNQKGKNGSSMTGTLKVASISGGVAKMIMNATMTTGTTGSMKLVMTSYVTTADSQMKSMDGTMSGFMGQPNAVAHIKMVRL